MIRTDSLDLPTAAELSEPTIAEIAVKRLNAEAPRDENGWLLAVILPTTEPF